MTTTPKRLTGKELPTTLRRLRRSLKSRRFPPLMMAAVDAAVPGEARQRFWPAFTGLYFLLGYGVKGFSK